MSKWTKNDSWHQPSVLEVHEFNGADNPLKDLPNSRQVQYLLRYLSGLKCQTIVCEPNYFDRDYLSEFSEFYSTSARGYPNTCCRLHFFSEKISRENVTAALGRNEEQLSRLTKSYLGFSVVRPIPCAPLGRTVLSWFSDRDDVPPRTKVIRKYTAHLAGLEFSIDGLAWQQQDTGVGACATIALWSAFHSTAFDDHHSIPTTTEITKVAHKTASLGDRVFPSGGLTASQLLEAIKELDLQPAMEEGELKNRRFSKGRFGALCETFLRSRYPMIVIARDKNNPSDMHAVCVVGIREVPSPEIDPGKVESKGARTSVLYVHDDNIGPQVRFEILTFAQEGSQPYVAIRPKAPADELYWKHALGGEDPTAEYITLIPEAIAIPMHGNVRTSPSAIGNYAQKLGLLVCGVYNTLATQQERPEIGVTVGTNFFLQKEYIGKILPETMREAPEELLGRVRMELIEKLAPMSLFLGVVRVWHKKTPLFDVLFDTTDSDRNMPVFGTVVYNEFIATILDSATETGALSQYTDLDSLGEAMILAFSPKAANETQGQQPT